MRRWAAGTAVWQAEQVVPCELRHDYRIFISLITPMADIRLPRVKAEYARAADVCGGADTPPIHYAAAFAATSPAVTMPFLPRYAARAARYARLIYDTGVR